jgi:phage-related protein
MNLDQSITQKLTSNELIARKLLTISLTGVGLGEIRVLENETFEKLDVGGEVFLAGPLKVTDVVKNDNFEYLQVSLSNVGASLSGLIGEHGDVITGAKCLLEEVFLGNDSTVISNRAYPLFVGQANNLSLTRELVTFDIEAVLGAYVAISPNMTYGVNCQWRKFKDCRCGYTGPEIACDKTMTRCKELGNLANFGGFPSLPREQVIKA